LGSGGLARRRRLQPNAFEKKKRISKTRPRREPQRDSQIRENAPEIHLAKGNQAGDPWGKEDDKWSSP